VLGPRWIRKTDIQGTGPISCYGNVILLLLK
jgi:hypothetical protein